MQSLLRLDELYKGILIPEKRHKKETLEEKINFVMEKPDKISEIIDSLKDDLDPSTAYLTFIDLLLKKYNSLEEYELNFSAIFQFLVKFICNLPTPIVEKFLQEYPLVFANLLDCLDPKQNRELLKKLTSRLNNWKTLFKNVFESLDKIKINDCKPQDLKAGLFLSTLLIYLSHHRQKQWIEFYANEVHSKDWAFFILVLNKSSRNLALNVLFRTRQLNLTLEGLLPCFEFLAKQNDYPDSVKIVVDKILHRFYLQKKFDLILDQIARIDFPIQICLLDAMTTSKRREVFYKYREKLHLLASWTDGLFHCQDSFDYRKRIIEHACDSLEKDRLTDFLIILNNKRSQVGPYLLICLIDSDFEEFIYTVPYKVRTELLSNGINDSTKRKIFKTIIHHQPNRYHLCTQMLLEMENSSVPVDPQYPLTLRECFDVLKQAIALETDSDYYAPFIEKIPAVLIGILAIAPENRNTLLKFIKHLTEKQLECFITSLNFKDALQVIESNWHLLDQEKFAVVLRSLSPHQLYRYIELKTEKIKSIYLDFVSKHKELLKAFDSAKEKGQITFATYSDYQNRVNSLRTLIRRTTSNDYHFLVKFLEEDQYKLENQHVNVFQNIQDMLQEAIENLRSKEVLFGKQGILTIQLNDIENLVVNKQDLEEDLTLTLYEGFWTFVREGTLPYLGISSHSSLGITNAGQLTLLGIRTNQDLRYIGISQEKQNFIENILRKIEKLFELLGSNSTVKENKINPQKDLQQTFQAIWQNIIDIKNDENNAKIACRQLIKIFDPQKEDNKKLKSVCLELCQQLISIEHLSEKDRAILKKGIDEINAFKPNIDPAIINNLFLYLLEEGLFILRGQYPLICLQRYLFTNVNLKKNWEKFRSLKCFSISDLFEKGLVHSIFDLYRLEEIINKNKGEEKPSGRKRTKGFVIKKS